MWPEKNVEWQFLGCVHTEREIFFGRELLALVGRKKEEEERGKDMCG